MDMEFFTNPSGWSAIFWAVVVGTAIKAIGARLPALIARWMGLAKGRLRLRYWRNCKKKLQRIRDANSDPLQITREITRSGVYLALFLITTMMWLPSSLLILYLVPEAINSPKLTIGLGTPPVYLFEILWLSKAKFLDDLFKYRRKIAQRDTRSKQTKKTKKSKALSTEPKSAKSLPAAQQALPI